MDEILNDIAQKMIERYSRRYKELGHNVKTLGWGTAEQQHYRFKQSLTNIQFTDEKNVVDIGCGFGDYLALLSGEGKPFREYIGLDINPDLINECKKIWREKTKANFKVANISDYNNEEPIADIGVMFGVLNLNLNKTFDNYEYSFQFIRNSFSLIREVLVVDFLSAKCNLDYPQEDFVFYHDPSKMLEFALSLTPNVILKHDYASIPQKEFMLFLYK
jgi:SAM-dependent methyltransferase